MTNVLIADPDPRALTATRDLLTKAGHRVVDAADPTELLDQLGNTEVDLSILDLELCDPALLERVRRAQPEAGVIFTAAFGTVEDAVQAMRDGAADFLSKPFTAEQLQLAVERAIETQTLRRDNKSLRAALDDRIRVDNMIATDARMLSILKTVRAAAGTRTTILITGESGTGKTLLARAIHAQSDRSDGPFVEVNCGALPESLLESELFGYVRGAFTGATRDHAGKFEAAHGGTIFLDEIGTSSPAFQVKLLRVLQERALERLGDSKTIQVDTRVVLATNQDLEAEVRRGNFREDLYYRINVIAVEMPPLRERPGDVPLMAEHFLRRFATEYGKPVTGFTPAALATLETAAWPGNIRQLENVIERAVVLCEGHHVDRADLPGTLQAGSPQPGDPQSDSQSTAPGASAAPPAGPAGSAPPDTGRETVPPPAPAAVDDDLGLAENAHLLTLREALLAPEKRIIERALSAHDGNRQATAQSLGINRSTLFNKMRKFGLL